MQLTHDEKLSDRDKNRPLADVARERFPGQPYYLKTDDTTGEVAPVAYQKQEYPMMVYTAPGEGKLVRSAEEHQRLMAVSEPVQEAAGLTCSHCGEGGFKNLGPHIRAKHPGV